MTLFEKQKPITPTEREMVERAFFQLYAPNTLLKEQLPRGRGSQRAAGERALVGEVLATACYDLTLPASSPDYQDARAWVDSGCSGAITFVQACEWLGIDPSYFRQQLVAGIELRGTVRRNGSLRGGPAAGRGRRAVTFAVT